MDNIDIMAELATPCVGWLSASALANRMEEKKVRWRPGRDPCSLAERAMALGLDTPTFSAIVRQGGRSAQLTDVINAGVVVAAAALPRLFGPAELQAVADDVEELQGATIGFDTSRALTGLTALREADLYAFLERRGTARGWSGQYPRVSLSGAIWLGKLMEEERSIRSGDDDMFPMDVALPPLRAAMRQGFDVADDAEEFELRCKRYDVRIAVTTVDEGSWSRRVVSASGWDLFRLAGVVVPGANLGRYRAALKIAYEALGIDAPGPPAESEPDPERTIRAGGRLVEIVG